MSEEPPRWNQVRITDARQRRVVPLDPFVTKLRGEHDVIDADTLRAITDEVGTGLQKWPRRALLAGVTVISLVLLAVGIRTYVVFGLAGTVAWLRGRAGVVLIIAGFLFVQWFAARKIRLGRVQQAMLAHQRCPHCGYDLHGLPPDPGDGATLCPECGCAWQVS